MKLAYKGSSFCNKSDHEGVDRSVVLSEKDLE